MGIGRQGTDAGQGPMPVVIPLTSNDAAQAIRRNG